MAHFATGSTGRSAECTTVLLVGHSDKKRASIARPISLERLALSPVVIRRCFASASARLICSSEILMVIITGFYLVRMSYLQDDYSTVINVVKRDF